MRNSHADVLLVTATEVESKAVLRVFEAALGQAAVAQMIGDRTYFNLGVVHEARVFLTESEMGAGGRGGAQESVRKGIESLSPTAVIMVGIAFGVDGKRQEIGEILVTENLRLYELQRVGMRGKRCEIKLRGDRPHASPRLINRFKMARLSWKEAPCVHFGVVLTGEKLVDNIDFRGQLSRFEPEAIGGEMEGAGLYVACEDHKVDWILVKAISDWADGKKARRRKSRQETAAQNAASFVLHALKFATPAGERLKPELKYFQYVSKAKVTMLHQELRRVGHETDETTAAEGMRRWLGVESRVDTSDAGLDEDWAAKLEEVCQSLRLSVPVRGMQDVAKPGIPWIEDMFSCYLSAAPAESQTGTPVALWHWQDPPDCHPLSARQELLLVGSAAYLMPFPTSGENKIEPLPPGGHWRVLSVLLDRILRGPAAVQAGSALDDDASRVLAQIRENEGGDEILRKQHFYISGASDGPFAVHRKRVPMIRVKSMFRILHRDTVYEETETKTTKRDICLGTPLYVEWQG